MIRLILTLLFFAAAHAEFWRAQIPISYYRLRIEYSTTSDWTTLDIKSPTVLTVKMIGTFGTPTRASAAPNQFALNQPLDDARSGKSVGMMVEAAVSIDALDMPLALLLRKGAINGSVVRLFLVTDGDPQLIREIGHQGAVPGNTGTNPLDISVDLSALRSVIPLESQTPPLDLDRMMWAFYYPWYRMQDWSSTQLMDRPATLYSSDDRQAIERQVDQALAAGIDGFISSWWGPGHYTDQNLKILLDVAQAKGFKITIYLETLNNDKARGEDELFAWLLYALSSHGGRPAWMKVNGKPLVVVWASGAAPLESWQRVFARVRERGLDAVYLGMGFSASNLVVFDGIHEYGVFNIEDLAGAFQAAGRSTRYYSLLADSPAPKIWAATAQPGYDERLIPGRRGQFKDRDNGAFYRSTFEAALASDPDWVFLTSWNEWWEHTYIEPSELYGDQYLKITREFSDKWKRKRLAAVTNAASYASGAVAPGEMVTLFGTDLAGDRVQVLFDGLPTTLVGAVSGQASAIIPYTAVGRPAARLQLLADSIPTNELAVKITASAPGIFASAIVNEDWTLNSPDSSAARGSIVIFYATGDGTRDGDFPVLPVKVTIGGQPAELLYAGAAPGIAGLMQVNARVPMSIAPGAAPLVLTVGEASSQAGVAVQVK